MSFTEWLDGFQRRHRWAGYPLAVFYKFFDDQGNYLAALITYYAFISLFPLLLLGSSILGFALQGNPYLQSQILNSTLSQFPVIGDQLGRPGGLQGSTVAVIVGVLGSLYGASGVAQATQNAMNVAWAVPRNKRPNPLSARLRSLLLLATAGAAMLATTAMSALGSSADSFGARIGGDLRIGATLLSVVVNAIVFIVVFRLATAHKHSFRDAAVGAVLAAILWQILQLLGGAYVGHVVKHASATNGVFALVLGLIAWIYLGAVCVVFCVEVNVVRVEHLYPRALLTPFTDNVNLTAADQDAYSAYAQAQRTKGFESVEVDFENDGQNAARKEQESQADTQP
ncbi:MAG: YihY/virulence factor BrkB family protein [Nocardioidaceae bacterium]